MGFDFDDAIKVLRRRKMSPPLLPLMGLFWLSLRESPTQALCERQSFKDDVAGSLARVQGIGADPRSDISHSPGLCIVGEVRSAVHLSHHKRDDVFRLPELDLGGVIELPDLFKHWDDLQLLSQDLFLERPLVGLGVLTGLKPRLYGPSLELHHSSPAPEIQCHTANQLLFEHVLRLQRLTDPLVESFPIFLSLATSHRAR